MLRSRLSIGLILGASLAALATVVHAQGAKRPMTLTGTDYAEIERLSADEDFYVKTSNGWRFKTRTHSRAPNGTKPAPAGTVPPQR